MQNLVLAVAGGALGAGARHLTNLAGAHWLGAAFPWSTLIVNVVGSFLMGVVFAASGPLLAGSVPLRTFLATGILGGFTTFSAFSLDAWLLMEDGRFATAAGYVLSSVILSIAALMAGLATVQVFLR